MKESPIQKWVSLACHYESQSQHKDSKKRDKKKSKKEALLASHYWYEKQNHPIQKWILSQADSSQPAPFHLAMKLIIESNNSSPTCCGIKPILLAWAKIAAITAIIMNPRATFTNGLTRIFTTSGVNTCSAVIISSWMTTCTHTRV